MQKKCMGLNKRMALRQTMAPVAKRRTSKLRLARSSPIFASQSKNPCSRPSGLTHNAVSRMRPPVSPLTDYHSDVLQDTLASRTSHICGEDLPRHCGWCTDTELPLCEALDAHYCNREGECKRPGNGRETGAGTPLPRERPSVQKGEFPSCIRLQ